MPQIKFGTDGWRAVIAEDFTFANLEMVAQAAADYWLAHPEGRERLIVIGYDRRFLSDAFARAAAEIFAGNGFKVILGDKPVPTPAVSLAVHQQKAVGGVVITASHNPPIFNGFKLKAHYGGSADSSMCRLIENGVGKSTIRRLPLAQAVAGKKIVNQNLRTAHYRALKRLVDFNLISESRLKLAHDALFGVGAGCFEDLLSGTTCQVTTLNAEHDPRFGGINPEPVELNYARSSAWLQEHPHDLCIVTDGDADRVGGMDGVGHPLTTHQIICLILYHYVTHRGAQGRVVKAITTTSMVDRMCEHFGLTLVETGVGFKHICAEILKGGVLLGFEESGGIAFPSHIPERDGLLAGLVLLELLAREKKPLGELLQMLETRFGPHYYQRADKIFPLEKREQLIDACVRNPLEKLLQSPVRRMETMDGVKFIARNESWLMLRPSGTEPLVRIYAEADSPEHAAALVRAGERILAKF